MNHRLGTQSRFKLAGSCPNKLWYTRKKQYANTSADDPFLEALAMVIINEYFSVLPKTVPSEKC